MRTCKESKGYSKIVILPEILISMKTKNLSYGMHAIGSACGAGKTTEIYHFIIQHYDEGIVYCVDSIEELRKMYFSLCRALVDTGKLNQTEIMMITSEQDLESQTTRQKYGSDPTCLFGVKILLLTHVRFFSSMINFFLIYHPQCPFGLFNGDFQGLLSRPDLRQWVFFDETPMWIRPFCVLNRSFLGIFSEKVNGKWQCKSQADIDEAYDVFISNTKQDPFQHNNQLDRLKKEAVLSMVPMMYPSWLAGPVDKDLDITFRPRDLVQQNMKTHIVVFEGAADLLLHSGQFPLYVSQGPKYCSNVNFSPIDMPTSRGIGYIKQDYETALGNVAGIIQSNINQGKKTLVCVWKTSDKSSTDIEESNESQHRDWVKDWFVRCFPQAVDMFDVIYYGENKCKSTNEYRDYSAIVLLGKWSLPTNKYIEHNRNWGTNITLEDLNLWFFVQLICRIGIRNHNGGSFDVYFTTDFSGPFIAALNTYFQTGQTPMATITRAPLHNILVNAGIKRDTANYIVILCSMYPGLEDHIRNHGTTQRRKIPITDTELKRIISTANGNYSRSKGRLIEALKKVNVVLDVV